MSHILRILALALLGSPLAAYAAAVINCQIGMVGSVAATTTINNYNPLSAATASNTVAFNVSCTRSGDDGQTANATPNTAAVTLTLGAAPTLGTRTLSSSLSATTLNFSWARVCTRTIFNTCSGGQFEETTKTQTVTYTGSIQGPDTGLPPQTTTLSVPLTITLVTNTTASLTKSIGVTVNAVKNCAIFSSSFSFGALAPSSTLTRTATGSISAQCTNTTPYSISFSGVNDGATNFRQLLNGSNSLNYQLYKDLARTQILTSGSAGNVSSIGTGATSTSTIYGAIPSGQFVAPGAYSGTVTMTISY